MTCAMLWLVLPRGCVRHYVIHLDQLHFLLASWWPWISVLECTQQELVILHTTSLQRLCQLRISKRLWAQTRCVLDKSQAVRLLCTQCTRVFTRVKQPYLSMLPTNAFNSINRMAALHNIRLLCPSIANILINCYRAPTKLFIGGDALLSQEGTTQGDPLSMPMYALATLPLIRNLDSSVDQTWYADDATATGQVVTQCSWWDRLCELGTQLWLPCKCIKDIAGGEERVCRARKSSF